MRSAPGTAGAAFQKPETLTTQSRVWKDSQESKSSKVSFESLLQRRSDWRAMGKERPRSADGEKPTSSKFERPCKKDPPSAPLSPKPRKAPKPTSLEKLIPVALKYDRPCYPESEKARPLYDYGPTKFTRPATSFEGLSSKSGGSKGKPGSQPAAKFTAGLSRQKSAPKYASGMFKRWGSPFPETCRKSGRACSPELTNMGSHAGSALAAATKRSPTWRNSTADIQKFFNGSSLVSQRMMQMTACAASAREPFPMSKARKLVFYQRVDKETFVEELEALKHAIADQGYHFLLHRVHINNLQAKHYRLEEKVTAIESINGSNAPRTGGVSRLSSKVAGMQMKITCLGNEITNHCVNIQNLKYRYQVCLTREACVQRDVTAGHAQRIQKEHRVLTKFLKELTSNNKKFLVLRDTILPEQKAWRIQKEKNIQEIKQKIKENDSTSKQLSNETYTSKMQVYKDNRWASSLIQEGKSLRAKLKYEQEKKRATQEEVWAKAYDTCLLGKNNRKKEKLKRAKEGMEHT